MARTKKNYCGYFRVPRGKKRAIINKARHRAIPPDAWDDINCDTQCYYIDRIAKALRKKGWDKDKIANRLVYHHGYKRWQVMQAYWYTHGD